MANVISTGEIGRVVDNSLAYLVLDESGKTLCFAPSTLDRYHGQSFAEYGIATGTKVSVDWNSDAEVVNRIAVGLEALADARLRRDAFSSEERQRGGQGASSKQKSGPRAQIELHPTQEPRGKAATFGALPKGTRAFGKLVNTAELLPGDLVLAREIEPDDISKMIIETQQGGGYHDQDAGGATRRCISEMVRVSSRQRSSPSCEAARCG